MRKIATLLLLLCLSALLLVACTEEPAAPTGPTAPQTPTTPEKPDNDTVLTAVYDWNFLSDEGLDKNTMSADEIKTLKDRGQLYWEITNGGTLYLKGVCNAATVPTFYDETDQPWRDFTSLQRDDAADGRPVLKSVIVAPTVMALPENAFKNCAELEAVTLSNTLSELPAYCFAGCEMLHSVTGGMGLSVIGEYALSSCSKLQRLEITEALTEICLGAFDQSCDKLGRDTVTNEEKALLIHFRGNEEKWLAHKELLTVNAAGNAAFESAVVLYVE